MHIALVEESRFHASLFERTAAGQHPDCLISSFGTARDFLKTLAIDRFDLAVIDQSLPDMESPEIIKRAHAQHPELPIIIISGDEPETAAGEIKEEVRGYLVKDREDNDLVPKIVGQVNNGRRLTLKRTLGEDIDGRIEHANLAEMMAATLQHEINNPLMTILGNVELLLGDPACRDTALAERLRIIESSARRIQESTQRLANLICPVVRQTPAGPMLQLEKTPGRARQQRSQTVLSNKSI